MIHCPACRPPRGAVKCTPHMRTAATESIGPIIHARGTRNVLHTTAAATLIANAPAGGQSACSRAFICPDENIWPKNCSLCEIEQARSCIRSTFAIFITISGIMGRKSNSLGNGDATRIEVHGLRMSDRYPGLTDSQEPLVDELLQLARDGARWAETAEANAATGTQQATLPIAEFRGFCRLV